MKRNNSDGAIDVYPKEHEHDYWLLVLTVEGSGNTEQEALDALLDGFLSILDTDGRAHAVRFAQALCGAIEAGRCHE